MTVDQWLNRARQIVGNRPSDRPDRVRYDTLLAELRRDLPALPATETERAEHELRRICGV
ncbi:MAG: hypothetical protein ACK5XA_08570 [Tagaea sp.]